MPKKGILVANLGSPTSPSRNDVKKFLTEFLNDPYVIGLPSPLRQILVSGFIAPLRSRKTARSYASIWSDAEGPLRGYTNALAEAIGRATQLPTQAAMRYGQPSVAEALLKLDDVDEVVLIPLFPQHADSTRTTLIEHVLTQVRNQRLKVIEPFYNDVEFKELLANHTRTELQPDIEHVLISFHSLPLKHLTLADPTQSHCLKSTACCDTPSIAHETCYRHQCLETARDLGPKLKVPYSVSFQSRLGRMKWLEPYTSDEVVRLARNGVKRLAIVCPAFTVDNFETLEEIGIRARDSFLQSGGEELQMLSCLNVSQDWVDFLAGRALAA